MKKTIWIINQYVGSPIHGMEFRHYYLAKEFVRKGYEVIIFSGSYSHLYKKLPNTNGTYTFETIDQIQYCWVDVPTYARSVSLGRFWNMFVFLFRMYFIPTKNISKPDAIIVSSPSLFPIFNGKHFADKYQAKLIFEVRDIWPLTIQNLAKMYSWHPLVLLLSFFEKYAYKKADNVCSVLPGADKHMIAQRMQANKFFYAPNGILLEEVENPEVLASSVQAQIPKDKFIVGYVGTIGVSNAMNYFIDAVLLLQNHPEIFFVVIGDGGEKEALNEKVSSAKNIIFIDPIPKQQVQSALQLFDACYIGWNDEPLYEFGISANKLYDYMYSAKPIIHSFSSENDPIQLANCGISCKAESPEAIKDAILAMHALIEDKRNELGKNGRSYVINHHSYDAIAQKFIDIINK
jgi:glycosyltransferase involved in cell wall biosynthesis